MNFNIIAFIVALMCASGMVITYDMNITQWQYWVFFMPLIVLAGAGAKSL